MTRARWPKSAFASVGEIIENSEEAGHTFRFVDKRIGRWAKAEDSWLLGYWKYGWAVDTLQIKEADAENGIISGVAIKGGKENRIENCIFRNFGKQAVIINNAENSGVNVSRYVLE